MIRTLSKKRAAQYRIYYPKAKKFREGNPDCVIRSPDCTGATQGVHHVRGKDGDQLLVEKDWLPSCNPCNGFMEVHDAWARERGFKKSRHHE